MSRSSEEAFVVHLVDDDESVRRALARLVKSGGFEARSHVSGEAFMDDFDPKVLGCAILDMYLPGLNGFELAGRISAILPEFPVVFLTGRGDIGMGVRAMKEGAFDFLTKPVQPNVLLSTLSATRARAQQAQAETHDTARYNERLQSLTPREREVLEAVVTGSLNKQIAYDLGLAEKTVKVHRMRVMQKMGLRNIAELVRASVTRRIESP